MAVQTQAVGTSIGKLLGTEHPIIQAPMAGGTTTPELVAAVSNARALGSVGAAYMSPEQIGEAIREIRRLTDRPFAVNLFAGGVTEGSDDLRPMLRLLGRWHQRLGIPPPEAPIPPADAFGAQLEAVLEAGVPVFSFTFGVPDAAALRELRDRDTVILGTATTVPEARLLQDAGVDAVVAQGSEAGAHRGTFAAPFEDALIGTMALVPQMVDAISIPVIASGGIMDGRGIVAAQALGAAGVQMGTAFMLTAEAGTSAVHRAKLLSSREDETTITRAFSGRPARGIRNGFIEDVSSGDVPIPGFPLQNSLTRAMRTAAAREGDAEGMSLWAGQGVGLARERTAGQLVEELLSETRRIRRSLSTQTSS